MNGRPDDLFRNVFVLDHAIDAYRIQFPEAGHRDLLNALTLGEEISIPAAMGLLGRKASSHKDGDRFVLATHRRGIFVVNPAAHIRAGDHRPDLLDWNVITYLRFQRNQEVEAHRLWPTAFANPPEPPAALSKEKPPLVQAEKKAQELGISPLSWDVVDQWGFSHAPLFEVELKDRNGKVLSCGQGGSKKEAAHRAAELWLLGLADS